MPEAEGLPSRCRNTRREPRDVSPTVKDRFGFAAARLMSFPDLYAGKIVAALDRQQGPLHDHVDRGPLQMFANFLVALLPHGPHNARDVLATHVLKRTGSMEQASYAIQDTPDTVAEHYGRFLPHDKAALAAQVLSQIWTI